MDNDTINGTTAEDTTDTREYQETGTTTRTRGRPKGSRNRNRSTNRNDNTAQEETSYQDVLSSIEVEQTPETAPDNEGVSGFFKNFLGAANDDNKASKRRGRPAKGATKEQAKVLAESTVLYTNLIAQAIVGPEASINPIEESLIVEPLTAMLESSNALAKTAKVANPIALILGVGIWGTRMLAIWQYKHPKRVPTNVPTNVPTGAPTAVQQPPVETPNGAVQVDFNDLPPISDIQNIMKRN